MVGDDDKARKAGVGKRTIEAVNNRFKGFEAHGTEPTECRAEAE